ncbi:GAP family protein [Streptomyces griseus]|uniref:GAP family protein n=1 Tax=Streptomyces griseus TaxID=1911 RepID=UPI0004C92F23|nr:GAP family protein [Streptomyces griseus]
MVLDLLLIGLAVTLFPLPVMAFVLVVASPRGVRKGLVFIAAWLACLVAVIGAVVLLTGGKPPAPRSPPSTAAQVVTLVLGIGLVGYAWYRRRHVRRGAEAGPEAEREAGQETGRKTGQETGEEAEPETGRTPRGATSPDGVSVRSAAALPVLLQPWGMVGAAAATVVQADLSDAGNVVALVAFCLLATSSLLAMELSVVFAPERAHRTLAGLRGWLARHKEPAVFGLCVLLGLWLISRSLYQLAP